MSRIQHDDDHGAEVPATKRRSFRTRERQWIWGRQGGICATLDCMSPIEEIDHRIPLDAGAGGEHKPWNWQGLCKPCHKLKTAEDIKAIAKRRRIHARRDGKRRPRKAIQSRGFEKRKPED